MATIPITPSAEANTSLSKENIAAAMNRVNAEIYANSIKYFLMALFILL
jgi:hypothetical protein